MERTAERAKTVAEQALAAALLVGLSPLIVGVGLAVRLDVGRPVLFAQKRTGYMGRPFKLYKFRTMREASHEDGAMLPDDQRITRLGRVLRRSSLDELPQLINVVRGELSFVGPRPLMHKYWQKGLYSSAQRRRFDTKPGLTGWAQVNGRNSISWEEKFEFDAWYVENQSLWLDLRILGRTLSNVFRGHGISQDGHATAEEFRGAREPDLTGREVS